MDACVVCLGACAMDFMFTVPQFPRPDEMVFATGEPCMRPGGSTANIASGLARLGVASRFIGKTGKDANGLALRKAFEADGVDTAFLIADANGRTAQTVIAVNSEGSRIIYSLGGTAILETVGELVPEMLDGASVLYIGEAFAEVARAAMDVAHKKGATVIFGPGGGVSWMKPEDLNSLMVEADYVFLSRSELNAASGLDTHDAAARELLRRGVKNVVATLGESGSACYTGSEESEPVMAGRFDVEAVDTTGAGDAFASGFISGLVQGLSTAQCLTRGNACAAMAISVIGAREALPTQEQLDRFIKARTGGAVESYA